MHDFKHIIHVYKLQCTTIVSTLRYCAVTSIDQDKMLQNLNSVKLRLLRADFEKLARICNGNYAY